MRKMRTLSVGLAALISASAAFLGISALSSEAATTLTVASDGSATYKTVQAAVNAVPANNTSRMTITIKAGTYRESVVIPSNKPYITFQGLGSTAAATVIVNNKPASTAGTTGSATVYVQAKEFNGHQPDVQQRLRRDPGRLAGARPGALRRQGGAQERAGHRRPGHAADLQQCPGVHLELVHRGHRRLHLRQRHGGLQRCQIYEKRSTGGPITAANTAGDPDVRLPDLQVDDHRCDHQHHHARPAVGRRAPRSPTASRR